MFKWRCTLLIGTFLKVISNILNGVYILSSQNYEKQDLVQAPIWCVHTVKKGQKGTPLTILYINKLVETVLNRKCLEASPYLLPPSTHTNSEREGEMAVYDINNTIVLHEWLIVQ